MAGITGDCAINQLLAQNEKDILKADEIGKDLSHLIQRVYQLAIMLHNRARSQNVQIAQKDLDLMLNELSKHCKLLTSWKNIAPQLISGVASTVFGIVGVVAHGASIPLTGVEGRANTLESLRLLGQGAQVATEVGARGIPGLLSPMTAFTEAEKKSTEVKMQMFNNAQGTNRQSSQQDKSAISSLNSAIDQQTQVRAQAVRSIVVSP